MLALLTSWMGNMSGVLESGPSLDVMTNPRGCPVAGLGPRNRDPSMNEGNHLLVIPDGGCRHARRGGDVLAGDALTLENSPLACRESG